MATETITLTVTGDTPTGVTLRTLTDAASGADVSTAAGLTLPAAFTSTGGQWVLSFTATGATTYAYVYRLAWADGSSNDEPGTLTVTPTYLTSRAQIEAGGKFNTDEWADANSSNVDAEIQAQFDRVVVEADAANKESADATGTLDQYPLTSSDPQYPALQRAATDFATARLQQIRPEAVADGKVPTGVTAERVARERLAEIWGIVRERAESSETYTGALPVADNVTCFPTNRAGFFWGNTYSPYYG